LDAIWVYIVLLRGGGVAATGDFEVRVGFGFGAGAALGVDSAITGTLLGSGMAAGGMRGSRRSGLVGAATRSLKLP